MDNKSRYEEKKNKNNYLKEVVAVLVLCGGFVGVLYFFKHNKVMGGDTHWMGFQGRSEELVHKRRLLERKAKKEELDRKTILLEEKARRLVKELHDCNFRIVDYNKNMTGQNGVVGFFEGVKANFDNSLSSITLEQQNILKKMQKLQFCLNEHNREITKFNSSS